MAEFKTYTCDVCGVQGALRFELRKIDYQTDPADGKRDYSDGPVDLCHQHAIERLGGELNRVLDNSEVPYVERRTIWRKLGEPLRKERGL